MSAAWPSGAQSPEGASEARVRQAQLPEPGLGGHELWALVPKGQTGLQGRRGAEGRGHLLNGQAGSAGLVFLDDSGLSWFRTGFHSAREPLCLLLQTYGRLSQAPAAPTAGKASGPEGASCLASPDSALREP